jgi:hypothetical protein
MGKAITTQQRQNQTVMWRGFNLNLELNRDETFAEFHKIGLQQYVDDSQQVEFILNTFVNNENTLDGTAIQNFWFPLLEADIFISHSHKNKDEAIALAGWLSHNFKLKTFIDSCIWGYSNKLLLILDKLNCWMPQRGVYDYNLRNHSTSHVHMMLSTALTMMIDKCECLFFLNTPHSIKSYGETEKTESPWIYSEIATTKIIEKKDPGRVGELNETFSHFDGEDEIKKGMTMTYDLDLTHLTALNLSNIKNWHAHKNTKEHPLDTLYRLHPPKKKKQSTFKIKWQ